MASSTTFSGARSASNAPSVLRSAVKNQERSVCPRAGPFVRHAGYSLHGRPGGKASWIRPSPMAGTVSGLDSLSASGVISSGASASPSSSGAKRTVADVAHLGRLFVALAHIDGAEVQAGDVHTDAGLGLIGWWGLGGRAVVAAGEQKGANEAGDKKVESRLRSRSVVTRSKVLRGTKTFRRSMRRTVAQ